MRYSLAIHVKNCEFSDKFLDQLAIFLKYARSLRFTERPDYEWLKDLLKDLFNEHNFKTALALDWILSQKKKDEAEKKKKREIQKALEIQR